MYICMEQVLLFKRKISFIMINDIIKLICLNVSRKIEEIIL